MKYLNKYNNIGAYNTAKSDINFALPHVSLIGDVNEVKFDPVRAIRIISTGISEISLVKLSNNQRLWYSKDLSDWEIFDVTTSLVLEDESVYVRGMLADRNNVNDYTQFNITGHVDLLGDITAIWNFLNRDADLKECCCYCMFRDCTGIYHTELSFPDKTASMCYNYMFQGCTNLISGPSILPSITASRSCYSSMFKNCSSLISSPILSALSLELDSYGSMFENCTSLTSTPELPAITLGSYCYNSMFAGCSSLITVPKMLPSTSLMTGCYASMFRQCTSITSAPILPAPILAERCYANMFSQCKQLNNLVCLATDISASNCLFDYLSNVSSSGTFYKDATMTDFPSGSSGIPEGWTVINNSES